MTTDTTAPIMLSDGLDTLLMQMATLKARVRGTYFGNTFSGTVASSRQHSVTFREEIKITLDEPTLIKVSPEDTGRIANILTIRAPDIESGRHTLKWERVAN